MRGENLKSRLQLDSSNFEGTLQCDVLMSQYTWLHVGGTADILYQPASEDDLANFLCALPKEIDITIVGHGSNLLVRDGGIEGVVIRLSGKSFGSFQQIDDCHIKVGASLPDKQLSLKARDIGLSGFEFYCGIVGNLGGALCMNAGAHQRETCDCVVEVYAIDRNGTPCTLSNADMKYAYRSNGVSENLIFTSALLRGEPDSKSSITQRIESVQRHREESQPIRERTGGSTFRNPPNNSAWKLLDAAGMRGATKGDAQFSPMHCNFLINRGAATAYDFESLGEQARQRVYDHSGILLEWEIKRLGIFEQPQEVIPFSPSDS